MSQANNVVIETMPESEDPNRIFHTGWERIEINTIRFRTGASAGLANVFEMPHLRHTKATNPMTKSEIESASPTYVKQWNVDNDVAFMDFVLDGVAQAELYLIHYAKADKIDLFTNANGAWIKRGYYYLEAGLDGDVPPQYGKNDASGAYETASDITNLCQGYEWKGRGTADDERHIDQVGRFLYSLGLEWKTVFPNYAAKAGASHLTERRDAISIFLCVAIKVYADHFFCGSWNSERGVSNIGFTQKNVFKETFNNSLYSAIAAFWGYLGMKGKVDELGSNLDSGNMAAYVTDFVDPQLVNGSALEEYLDDILTQYECTDLGLKKGRQAWGIGEASIGSIQPLKYHFANLLDLGYEDTGYTEHGIKKWTVGLNLAIGLKYFEDQVSFKRYLKNAVKRFRHYSREDLSNWYDSLFVDISFGSTFKGIAEPESFRGLRATLYFTDTDYTTNAPGLHKSRAPSPNGMHSTGTIYKDPSSTGGDRQYLWIVCFAQGYLGKSDKYGFYNVWNRLEINWLMYWGMMLSTESSDTWLETIASPNAARWGAHSLVLVEVVNGKDTEDVLCLAYGKSAYTRFEFNKEPIGSGSPGLKYRGGLFTYKLDENIIYEAPRPKGLGISCYIDNIGNQDIQRELIRGIWPSSKASGNKSIAEAATTSPPPPTGTSSDNTDRSDEDE